VTYTEPTVVTYTEPDIVVTAPRPTDDQLITDEVIDRIATNGRISGRVDVETYRRDVTLRGRVTTPGQADRAEREARSVDGVRDVNNLLRTRVGG
jgi:osmotically-inducible protein OsmY